MCAELTRASGCVVQVRTYQRHELGESPITTPIVEAVRVLTKGRVTPNDFHDVRMEYIRSGIGAPDQRFSENRRICNARRVAS
jgi:hypothetical protein